MSMSKVRVYIKMRVYIKVYLIYGMLTCKNIYITYGTLKHIFSPSMTHSPHIHVCQWTDSKVEQKEGEREI